MAFCLIAITSSAQLRNEHGLKVVKEVTIYKISNSEKIVDGRHPEYPLDRYEFSYDDKLRLIGLKVYGLCKTVINDTTHRDFKLVEEYHVEGNHLIRTYNGYSRTYRKESRCRYTWDYRLNAQNQIEHITAIDTTRQDGEYTKMLYDFTYATGAGVPKLIEWTKEEWWKPSDETKLYRQGHEDITVNYTGGRPWISVKQHPAGIHMTPEEAMKSARERVDYNTINDLNFDIGAVANEYYPNWYPVAATEWMYWHWDYFPMDYGRRIGSSRAPYEFHYDDKGNIVEIIKHWQWGASDDNTPTHRIEIKYL